MDGYSSEAETGHLLAKIRDQKKKKKKKKKKNVKHDSVESGVCSVFHSARKGLCLQ